jgi:glutamate-5-semialdehyde dehydrogenase
MIQDRETRLPNVDYSYEKQARRARESAHELRCATQSQRTAVIHAMARRLRGVADEILEANRADLVSAELEDMPKAKLDRLRLDEKRLEEMATGIEAIAGLPDPLGEVFDERHGPTGIRVRRVRVPIGVIFMIFEARPNVTAEAAALCLRSGNAVLLRGGREATHSNRAIGKHLCAALMDAGLPLDAVQVIEGGHEAVDELLQMDRYIDLVIPRGGETLIQSVTRKSRIPVIKHYKGNCHIYVDRDADEYMAMDVVYDAKVQRPATCNAAEKLLIHADIASSFLPSIVRRLEKAGVRVRGDEAARSIESRIEPATAEDWPREYLDLVIAVRIVKDVNEAIRHIAAHGSGHTDAIITENEEAAQRFLTEVDSSSVMWNCSTRLADGGHYGLGAEIGISTDRLHARGPMGAQELTCLKWVVMGQGQLRGTKVGERGVEVDSTNRCPPSSELSSFSPVLHKLL